MAYTFYFEDIIPDYESWKNVMTFLDYDDPIIANFDLFCFNLISRHYSKANVRYSDPESFKAELFNVYQNKFNQFLQEKQIIDAIHKLTLEEMLIANTSLSNMANNPNTEPDDPTKPLNFISAQTYMTQSNGRVRAYLEALNNIPSLNIYKFFKANNEFEMGFDDLFMVVIPNQEYYY